MDDSISAFKKQNRILKMSVAGLGLVVAGCLAILVSGHTSSQNYSQTSRVNLPTDDVDSQSLWRSHLQMDYKLTNEKVKSLEEIFLNAQKKKEEQLNNPEIKNLTKDFNELKTGLMNEISFLKQQLEARSEEKDRLESIITDIEPKPTSSSYVRTNAFQPQNQSSVETPTDDFGQPLTGNYMNGTIAPAFNMSQNLEGTPENKSVRTLQVFRRAGDESSTKSQAKHVKNSIPHGVSVKAIIVASVDAPCGVYSTSDPHPVKLRILDDGKLPHNVKVKLKGGVITASAFGDLSAERVYMRLEKMTQNKPNGEYLDTVVTGYITGEDGRYGIRGPVVDRSDKVISNAAISGFFAGASQLFQAKAGAQSLLAATSTTHGHHVSADFQANLLKEGGFAGGTKAFDRMADYFIRKAELIQPIIQISAGRIVDITFTESIDFGSFNAKEKIKNTRTTYERGTPNSSPMDFLKELRESAYNKSNGA